MSTVREKLERALEEGVGQMAKAAFDGETASLVAGAQAMRHGITAALAQLSEMERDHEAMREIVNDLGRMWWNEMDHEGSEINRRVSVRAEHMAQFSELQKRADAILGKGETE